MKSLTSSSNTATDVITNFYCDGERLYLHDYNLYEYCDTNSSTYYFTLQYDTSNTQYQTYNEALEKAVSDGYLTKDNVKNLISRSIFIYLTIMIVEVFISIILLFSPFSNILEMNNNSLFKLFISTLILFVALFVFYIKPFKKLIKDTVEFFNKKDLLFNLLVVTLIIFLISCITFKNALNFKSITYSAINIITLICFIIIFSVCLYNIILRKKAENKEEVLLNFIKEYEYLIDKDRINRHEMLNNLLVIKSFKNRNSKDFENLIDQFINNYKMAGSKIASNLYNLPSGLKGMVYYKIYDMEKYNIKVETNISNKVVGKLDNLDATTYTKICKIIGILIDNAIEACEKINDK